MSSTDKFGIGRRWALVNTTAEPDHGPKAGVDWHEETGRVSVTVLAQRTFESGALTVALPMGSLIAVAELSQPSPAWLAASVFVAGGCLYALVRQPRTLTRFTIDLNEWVMEFQRANVLRRTTQRIPLGDVASVGTRSEWEAENRPGRSFWAHITLRSGEMIDLSNTAEPKSRCEALSARIAALAGLPISDYAAP
jgi:hypothetical protein